MDKRASNMEKFKITSDFLRLMRFESSKESSLYFSYLGDIASAKHETTDLQNFQRKCKTESKPQSNFILKFIALNIFTWPSLIDGCRFLFLVSTFEPECATIPGAIEEKFLLLVASRI